MADYFPLISRAVSGLDPSSPERRQAIYARAKDALDRQLTSLDPPIAPEDLARERAALADAVNRVEAQFAALAPVVLQPAPPPPLPVAPPPPAAPLAPPAGATARPTVPPPAPAPRPAAPPITSASIPRPQPPGPAPAGLPHPARPVSPQPHQQTTLGVSVTSASIPKPQPPASPPLPPRPAPAALSPDPHAPGDVPAGGTHIIIDPTENGLGLGTPPRPKLDPQTSRGFAGRKGLMLAVAVGLPAFLAIGALAYLMRDDPALYRPQTGEQPAPDTPGGSQRKASGRLDGSGSAPAAGPRRAPQQDQLALPVATRVIYFEESADDPRGKQSDGQVIWRLDALPGAGGAAPMSAVRGSVSVADAKMSMEMLVRPNREAALPASHTVEITFKPEGERESIAEIGPIEARDQETQPGYQLKGAMVPVADNLFLIGLDRDAATVAKNIEAMRDRRWFAFQFRLKNNRIGAVLIEKGPTGDRVFKDAIDAWGR